MKSKKLLNTIVKRGLLVLSSIFLSTILHAQVKQNQIFRNGDLEISFETEFINQWDDRGSGADRNGGFFRPKLHKDSFPNFHSLGDMIIPGYNPAGYAMAVVRDVSVAQDILKPAVDMVGVWNDSGSGASRDGQIWRPVPPEGYIAMGLVAGPPGKPANNTVMCIKKEYVIPAKVLVNVWDDRGSGANSDFSGWSIDAPDVPGNSGTSYVSANTFIGHNSYGAPSTGAYALIIPIKDTFPINDIPEFPVLSDYSDPEPFAAGGTVSTSYLPWYSVKDAEYNMLQQMTLSPTYKMVRRTRYKLVNFLYNQTDVDQVAEWSTTSGTSKSQSETYAQETGIEIYKSWKSVQTLKSGKVSISMSPKFTHTSQSAEAWTTETTRSLKLTVPTKTASAGYILESSFKLYREDGTVVFQGIDHRPSGSFFAVSYPRTSTGVTEIKLLDAKIYPTTSTGEFTVDIENAFVPNQQRISVYDLRGNLVLTQNILSNLTTVNLTGHTSGIYLIKVLDGQSVLTKKIILE